MLAPVDIQARIVYEESERSYKTPERRLQKAIRRAFKMDNQPSNDPIEITVDELNEGETGTAYIATLDTENPPGYTLDQCGGRITQALKSEFHNTSDVNAAEITVRNDEGTVTSSW